MVITIKKVDYEHEKMGTELIYLLNHYALDPMGGGKELSDYVKENLLRQLATLPHAFSYIGYVDQQPAGLVNCFESLSTFAAKPLINIHDLMVHSDYRGLGLSQKLLEKVQQRAEACACCKITLEVLEGNKVAFSAYEKFGFSAYELDPKAGNAVFLEKKLC
jgi:ribosomal protein S18 acetylase RimI-like enzyme